ncbi:MAG: hypothetical protein IH620_04865 [Ignavibacterium sp.]|nr:hypothetical protein [Ignavibacterium sp.]
MFKIKNINSHPNIDGFFRPFKSFNQSSNVSPNNRIVNAYFYGSPHPGFPDQSIVSTNNKFIKSFFFDSPIEGSNECSKVSSNNKLVNSKLNITKDL